jgi:hypothetical protein
MTLGAPTDATHFRPERARPALVVKGNAGDDLDGE